MQAHIRLAIEALLKIDSTVTMTERKRLLLSEDKAPASPEVVITRLEAAKRFHRCPRSLDNWVNRGWLKKWKLPGTSRSIGFRESEILALIESGGGQTQRDAAEHAGRV